MEVCALASHSSGNSFFVKANGSQFLVDAGITCKQIMNRLSSIGYDASALSGVLITHAHTDHIRGLDVLTRKFRVPIYVTPRTFEAFKHHLKGACDVKFIEAGDTFNVGDVNILPFSKSHDCADPVSYSISYGGKTASVITDIGYACDNVKAAVHDSDILCLESNHDPDMLVNGPYPYYLKHRIASDKGHLSNYAAATLVMEHAAPKLRHVLLSHLSKTNNTPELAMSTMKITRERKDLSRLNLLMTSKEDHSEIVRV